ncbi:hypothetical protein [Blastomonas sp.]|uniref:hypothetical protein n=1 Tax=Blastomonas sp. TaxID=1909299 RepID=UPI0026288716|nr:hypothetical protein [Blastomonas sp.]MDM7955038.1 hypothetical protein [Blastomonas sp.]
MNAITWNLAEEAACGWEPVEDTVHIWRAKCMSCYSEAEYAISETIALLRKVTGKSSGSKTGHLFGHKVAELAARFSQPDIKALKRARKASQSLDKFQSQGAWRNILNHSAMTVYASREGSWLAEFKMITLSEANSTTSRTFIDEAMAQDMLLGLRSAVQSLATNLQHFRTELAAEGKAPSVTPSAPGAQGSR